MTTYGNSTISLRNSTPLSDGTGYVFITGDGFPILTTDRVLDDKVEGKDKWKIGISVSSGCRLGCLYCFTNSFKRYRRLTVDELTAQVHYVVSHPRQIKDFDEIKVEFKEMGDPNLNVPNVCKAKRKLEEEFPDFLYVISSPGLKSRRLYQRLKNEGKGSSNVRLQFSLHTTSDEQRAILCPRFQLMDFAELSSLINEWYDGKHRVTLTFVPFEGYELDSQKMSIFDPEKVFIKISYLDVTTSSVKNGLEALAMDEVKHFMEEIDAMGYRYACRCGINTSGNAKWCELS